MRRLVLALSMVSGLVALLHHLGRSSGSTRAERRRLLPGDELVSPARIVATHAATLPAPPEDVWPWLLQVGWHRGGWYTPPVGRRAVVSRQPAERRSNPARAPGSAGG